jgi:glycine betaine catabolism A
VAIEFGRSAPLDRPALDRAALERAAAPSGEATLLPAGAYTSDEVWAWEKVHFFDESWVCVGRGSDLGRAGDQKAVRTGAESVLLVRDDSGSLNAFYNVCRHRAHELLEPGSCVNRRAVKCPYHAWVYGLDGSLRGAPRFGDVPGFDTADHPLVPVRVVEWDGWVFVNASGTAPEWSDHVGLLDEMLAAYGSENLVSAAARHEYVVQANWKIITENYHECYHCSQIHPQLCEVTPPDSGKDDDPNAAWVGGSMDLRAHAQTMSLTGESGAPVLPGLSPKAARQVLYYSLWPNLLISLHPDYVMTHRLEPLGPSQTRVECEWLWPAEVVADSSFDPTYATEFWDVTNLQDWQACESVQRGVSSRGFIPGPLSYWEGTTHQFIALVANSYLQGRVTYQTDVAPDPFRARR